MKRTHQPKKLRRLKKHGFRNKSDNVKKRRRKKGRSQISASDEFRKLKKKPKNRNK